MRALPRPIESADDVFTLCISKVRDATLKARLTSVSGDVSAASNAFDIAVSNRLVHQVPQSSDVGGVVTADEMVAVYAQRMAKKGAPGRPVYDRLLAAPPHGRCPLCGQRVVSTLDHHLPKQLFPGLAVSPLNLVPACTDCNKAKGEFVPGVASQQTLHPYFDNVENETWLSAELLEQNPPAMRFRINAPEHWSPELAQRVKHHFELLRLGELYTSHAAEELVNIRFALAELHSAAGGAAVRAHLVAMAESYFAARRNSWQTAMYLSLAGSHWFCESGFDPAQAAIGVAV